MGTWDSDFDIKTGRTFCEGFVSVLMGLYLGYTNNATTPYKGPVIWRFDVFIEDAVEQTCDILVI